MILKDTKNQGYTLSLENIIAEEPQGGRESNLPPSLFWVKTTPNVNYLRKRK